MKATDTRYYYNADENLCADEEFAVYFLCEVEGLTAEEALEGLHTKREFYGWFDTAFKCADDIPNKPSCSTCVNVDQDTIDKVACCNCCEDYSFYQHEEHSWDERYIPSIFELNP